MSNNIIAINTIIEYAKKLGKKGILIQIDFRAAFDLLEYPFIRKVFDFLGLGYNMKRWLDIMLHDFAITISHFGNLLEPFVISRAVKQGDIASPSLFILCLEILMIKLRKNTNIKRLQIYNWKADDQGYADDLTLLTDYDSNSLREVFKILINSMGCRV